MIYREEKGDIFDVDKDYYFAHCISADFTLGAGIAVQFNNLFNLKYNLYNNFPNYMSTYVSNSPRGDCLLIGKVFNLVTKKKYWDKPSYRSITLSLQLMKCICKAKNITKIAMTKIGCGLDRLEWNKVSKIIQDTFKDTNIEILVRYLY